LKKSHNQPYHKLLKELKDGIEEYTWDHESELNQKHIKESQALSIEIIELQKQFQEQKRLLINSEDKFALVEKDRSKYKRESEGLNAKIGNLMSKFQELQGLFSDYARAANEMHVKNTDTINRLFEKMDDMKWREKRMLYLFCKIQNKGVPVMEIFETEVKDVSLENLKDSIPRDFKHRLRDNYFLKADEDLKRGENPFELSMSFDPLIKSFSPQQKKKPDVTNTMNLNAISFLCDPASDLIEINNIDKKMYQKEIDILNEIGMSKILQFYNNFQEVDESDISFNLLKDKEDLLVFSKAFDMQQVGTQSSYLHDIDISFKNARGTNYAPKPLGDNETMTYNTTEHNMESRPDSILGMCPEVSIKRNFN